MKFRIYDTVKQEFVSEYIGKYSDAKSSRSNRMMKPGRLLIVVFPGKGVAGSNRRIKA